MVKAGWKFMVWFRTWQKVLWSKCRILYFLPCVRQDSYHRSALLHVVQQTISFMQGEKSHWLINKQPMHVESDCRKQSRWVLLKSAPCIVEDTDIRPVVELSKCGLGLARRGAIVVILNTTSVNTLDSVTGRWGWLEAIQCVSSLGPVPVIYFSSELQN